jgi:pimeloyl-ACP methyl ester carboxylesterase
VFSRDLQALADALGWSTFVLLGHSMGGMVAQVLALDAPQRLAGLVLMDTSPASPEGIDPALVETGRQIVAQSGLPALVNILRDMEDPLASPAHVRLCEIRPGYKAWNESKTLGASPDMWLAMSRELLEQDDRLDALASLRVPTLVICGEQDLGFLEHSRRMAKAIPDARLAVIGQGGHSPQFESPDEWWRELSAFLAQLAGA